MYEKTWATCQQRVFNLFIKSKSTKQIREEINRTVGGRVNLVYVVQGEKHGHPASFKSIVLIQYVILFYIYVRNCIRIERKKTMSVDNTFAQIWVLQMAAPSTDLLLGKCSPFQITRIRYYTAKSWKAMSN